MNVRPPRGFKKAMKMILWSFLLSYAVVLLILFWVQRSLIYFPEKGTESDYLAQAARSNLASWRDRNGKLIGWKRANSRAKNRMVVFHGNGGTALMRTYFLDGLGALENGNLWEFYVLEYPGYAWRDGAPSQNSILAAAQSALDDLGRDDARPVFLCGESLGTGVASLLAAKNPNFVRGLFLVTPFTSAADVAAEQFPVFPVRWMLLDQFHSAKALKSYSGPVAVLLAGRDVNVPTRFGQQLFDGYQGPKKRWIQAEAGHNSLDYNPKAAWWKEVSDFLLKVE